MSSMGRRPWDSHSPSWWDEMMASGTVSAAALNPHGPSPASLKVTPSLRTNHDPIRMPLCIPHSRLCLKI